MAPKRPASSPMRLRGAKSARPSTSGKQIPDMKIDGILKEAGETPRRIQPTNGTSKIEGFRDKHPRVQFSDSKGLVNDGNNCYRNAVRAYVNHLKHPLIYLPLSAGSSGLVPHSRLCSIYYISQGLCNTNQRLRSVSSSGVVLGVLVQGRSG